MCVCKYQVSEMGLLPTSEDILLTVWNHGEIQVLVVPSCKGIVPKLFSNG